jgi:hypothetical protein
MLWMRQTKGIGMQIARKSWMMAANSLFVFAASKRILDALGGRRRIKPTGIRAAYLQNALALASNSRQRISLRIHNGQTKATHPPAPL